MRNLKLHQDNNENAKRDMYRIERFEMVGIDETFEAFTKGETWNGFECPYFTKEEALKFMNQINKEYENQVARYDEETDEFVFELPYDDVNEVKGNLIQHEGKQITVYDFGGGWVWQLHNKEER